MGELLANIEIDVEGDAHMLLILAVTQPLPAAESTGNLTLKPNSIVHKIIYDKEKRRATGVEVIDSETKEVYNFNAKIIFLCASSSWFNFNIDAVKIEFFPNGMGKI